MFTIDHSGSLLTHSPLKQGWELEHVLTAGLCMYADVAAFFGSVTRRLLSFLAPESLRVEKIAPFTITLANGRVVVSPTLLHSNT